MHQNADADLPHLRDHGLDCECPRCKRFDELADRALELLAALAESVGRGDTEESKRLAAAFREAERKCREATSE